MLEKLKTSVESLHSTNFGNPAYPVLDAFPKSLVKFVEQLERGYVSTFSGRVFLHDLVKTETKNPVDPKQTGTKAVQPDENKYTLTEYGEKCAKIILTILNMLNSDLNVLKNTCKNISSSSQINKSSHLGDLLTSYGYRVSDKDKQNGELQDKSECKGSHVSDKMREAIPNANMEHLTKCLSDDTKKPGAQKSPCNLLDILSCLFTHLSEYNKVGHIATFSAKRTPCSVYEMLSWCCGLEYNSAYSKMQQHCKTWLEREEKKEKQEKERVEAKGETYKPKNDTAFKSILSKLANRGLPQLFVNSRSILTTILGTGDAETVYASDFANNKLNLKYPTSGEECLNTLLDILRRLFPPLRYMHYRCNLRAKHYGWDNCQYGKNIPTTKWPCNVHSADKSTCQPNCQANDQPNCQPTSPLQCYLTDSLLGHLPHDVTSIGCKTICNTCPKSMPGMPCITPMGFRGFSSSTRRGTELCKVLDKIFDDADLISLFSLVAKTPSTLPEHFGFVLSLVNDWHESTKLTKNIVQTAFKKSISDVSISLYENVGTLTDALRDAYGSSQSNHESNKHEDNDTIDGNDDVLKKRDVSSLSMTIACSGQNVHCAPYLVTLCHDAYYYLNTSHSNTYLSWAVYLPWAFYQYLKNLYDTFCAINCQDWGCRGCLRGDKCKTGKHGVVDKDNASAICQCPSLVQCKGVLATLYTYGFTFGNAARLNSKGAAMKCSDFCTQLYDVLHSSYFRKLFDECDNFLKEIRWPFMLTLLALWSLSLLYLLHIVVVRLDVLRIRSHLRSPSSHRIAAQSLLAVAKVGKIANVKYFSP
ncbi:hypothetical protein, conserved [Babesia ovata]|uniref:C3H1-type domain-containing protein n=1 Tax=Babesia ovata TaxID=189622 RepID=A0A2H6KIV7_9APIC|nr:uncharacterized protein BOVATA_044110 [Babesia ovata]GBE62918.1 hypothetical protein, conserved [Babesia ovata]